MRGAPSEKQHLADFGFFRFLDDEFPAGDSSFCEALRQVADAEPHRLRLQFDAGIGDGQRVLT